jgi:hypothetical protein
VKSGWLQELLRWGIAGSVATAMTLAIFIAMTRMIDGSAILATIVRIFPLTFASLEGDGECDEDDLLAGAVTIEGAVGYHGADGFAPLADAEILRENTSARERTVEVRADGSFRFVTAFASDAPTSCPPPRKEEDAVDPKTVQQLRLRAPGCVERRVPLTRAWQPHRLLLECRERR